ncbi:MULTISPECIES: LytTR family DNA-binding domain-containing protein [Shouchella]
MVVISLNELLYIERIGSRSLIQTCTRMVEVNLSLKQISETLPNNFVRSHKSFIINKERIIEINTLNTNTVECVFEGDKSALLTKNNVDILFS